jgi:hypothetical protein
MNGTQQNGTDFARRQLRSFGLTLITMGICFPLYYLGFFGTVEGPLQPDRIGDTLAGLGIARIHFLAVFVAAMILSLAWPQIVKLAVKWSGRRAVAVQGSQTGIVRYTIAAIALCFSLVVLFK